MTYASMRVKSIKLSIKLDSSWPLLISRSSSCAASILKTEIAQGFAKADDRAHGRAQLVA